MKTTIDLSDELATQAKTYAAQHKLTLRTLIEQGLRQVINTQPEKKFRLRNASMQGKGLQKSFQDANWSDIQQEIYSGHGT
jgi:predicted ATPase